MNMEQSSLSSSNLPKSTPASELKYDHSCELYRMSTYSAFPSAELWCRFADTWPWTVSASESVCPLETVKPPSEPAPWHCVGTALLPVGFFKRSLGSRMSWEISYFKKKTFVINCNIKEENL